MDNAQRALRQFQLWMSGAFHGDPDFNAQPPISYPGSEKWKLIATEIYRFNGAGELVDYRVEQHV